MKTLSLKLPEEIFSQKPKKRQMADSFAAQAKDLYGIVVLPETLSTYKKYMEKYGKENCGQ